MIRQPVRRAFDTGKTFTCRLKLESNGQVFRQGEVLPWRKLGITEQRLFELWNACHIEVNSPAPAAKPKA